MRRPVDIIIPVYNAYEDLVKCVESVTKHTDLAIDRVILVNDCSTDERIMPYLSSLKADNVVFINNEVNMGFSNNVNKGFAYSDVNDVILLNSDTIVTAGWVDKISRCAYQRPEIGTVTPMSNRATLCSYPVICYDNDIPEYLTIDELAKDVERASMHEYPRITVAVGFCMFIKRETINKVGPFDAETFGRGYGEENDFCNRAEQLGYIHVMCDDTFIYHKGTVSFMSEEKQKLIEEHQRIISERYHAQDEKNSKYCNSGRDKYIRDNIDIYAKADPNRKSIMYIVHADFHPEAWDNIGGTQFHVRDLTRMLRYRYNIYVAARDEDFLRVTLYSDDREVSLKYYIDEADSFPRIRDSKLHELFGNLYKAFKIDMIHVHHTYKLGFDMIEAADELGIPVLMTMHDNYHLCPNVKMLDCNNRLCVKTDIDEACTECLRERAGVAVGKQFLIEWRKECGRVLGLCKAIIVPSQFERSRVELIYPQYKDIIRVIPHGICLDDEPVSISEDNVVITDAVNTSWDNALDDEHDPYLIKGWAFIEGIDSMYVQPVVEIECEGSRTYVACTKDTRFDVSDLVGSRYLYAGFLCNTDGYENKTVSFRLFLKYKDIYYSNGEVHSVTSAALRKGDGLNIAFVGGMCEDKGSGKVYDAITSVTEGVTWHIFGIVADGKIIDLKQSNVIKHGRYDQRNIGGLLKMYDIDVVCVLSSLGETFCYTVSESVAGGVPVFATDVGAVGDRVRENGYGWLVPVDMPGSKMAEKLIEILKDEDEYRQKKQKAQECEEPDIKVMAEQYVQIYDNIMSSCPVIESNDFDRAAVFEGLGIAKGKDARIAKSDDYIERTLAQAKRQSDKDREKYNMICEKTRLELEDAKAQLEATKEVLRSTRAVLDKIQSNPMYKMLKGAKHLIKRG